MVSYSVSTETEEHAEHAGEIMVLQRQMRSFLYVFILFTIGAVFYREPLYNLYSVVLHREGSSHGIFVPFISGYLLWLKFDRIKGIKQQTSWLLSVFILLLGVILFFLSNDGHYLSLSILSFMSIASALILLLFGVEIFKEVSFPLLFLATMIPLPIVIYEQISSVMRIVNTWGSVAIAKTIGVPLYREGFYIYLPGARLFVDDACSGIRYLLSYFTFSVLYAYLFKQSNIVRLLVVASSFPIAVLAGIMRLSFIFMAAYYISPVMAEYRPHVIVSWFVFAAFLFIAIALDQYFMNNSGQRREDKS